MICHSKYCSRFGPRCACSRVRGLGITDRNHCATEDSVLRLFFFFFIPAHTGRDDTPRPQPTQKLEFSILSQAALRLLFSSHETFFSLTFFTTFFPVRVLSIKVSFLRTSIMWKSWKRLLQIRRSLCLIDKDRKILATDPNPLKISKYPSKHGKMQLKTNKGIHRP